MPDRCILLVIGPDGAIHGDLAGADAVALAEVNGCSVRDWRLYRVRWSATTPGSTCTGRYAAIVQFVAEHAADAIVAGSVPSPLRESLAARGVPVFVRDGISARAAALSAATALDATGGTPPTDRRPREVPPAPEPE